MEWVAVLTGGTRSSADIGREWRRALDMRITVYKYIISEIEAVAIKMLNSLTHFASIMYFWLY